MSDPAPTRSLVAARWLVIGAGILCLAMALLNINQESPILSISGTDQLVGLVILTVLSAAPFVATWFWASRARDFGGVVLGACLLITLTGLLAYAMYLLGGASDPNTAAHMHVLLFPIVHLVLTLVVIALASLLRLLLRKTTNPAGPGS